MLKRCKKRKFSKICIILLLVIAFSLPQVSSLGLAQSDAIKADHAYAVTKLVQP